MKALIEAIGQDASVRQAVGCFRRTKGESLVYGLSGAQKHVVFAAAYEESPRPFVILVHDRSSLEAWREDLTCLLPGRSVVELPEVDVVSFQATAKSVELMAKRMDALGRLMRREPVIVLATAEAAMQKGIARQEFERLSLRLAIGEELSREALINRLAALGYERAPEVEHVGEFGVRGGIVDIFPINTMLPVRVELFGDEIDSLREFDVMTKRSVRNLGEISVLPLAGAEARDKAEACLAYLGGAGTVLFDEPMRLRETILNAVRENPEARKNVFTWEEMIAAAKGSNVVYSALMLQKVHDAEPSEIVSVTARSVAPYQKQMDLFASDVRDWVHGGFRVLIVLGDDVKSHSMREMLAHHNIPSVVMPHPDTLSDRAAAVAEGALTNGFELPGAKVVVVTERDIFGHQKKKLRMPKVSNEARISHFREIREGDYVVHVSHGIGKYLGVKTLDVGGVKRDYLHIKYGGDDKLFVPTDQVQLLQKYIGAEGETPRLSRMGGTEWAKTKARARASVEDIAKDLIKLYAKRRETIGFAFPEDTPWQRDFEDAFPYEETPDQLMAVREIKEDMEKPVPMDRLLCGDVGFGKTEVAIRAAFKAVMGGKQVAVLVPTTVLAQQHYKTFTERFLNFGPNVDVICRFRTAKEQRESLERLRDGRTDILIGTHAILNQKRVEFKNLGLLIVDEEQRFGVKQKEKIKTLSAGVDVLTLSATPIPRTLHMSLAGARDMSVIETPPEERYPIQTYVIESNDDVIAGAIRREIKRGGQIYFIYNRVETIERMRLRLEALVPEARIQTAHGQMPESLLERVMMDFYEGEYDILLATSIVENGLDVANANTIIVYNADYFGLSQLYQMRGRVGRSHRMAFAYFVYQRDKVLSEASEKRLHAMKEFAELGAGFKIAMRDLEIRGAGDLLGAQQHGHIAGVGFEMYCRLLDEAVQELETGVPVEEIPEPVIELAVEAYLDGGYIDDAMHKIEIYQRVAAVRNEAHLDALLDDLIDRFGEPTKPVLRLLDVARIKNYARTLGIRSLVEKDNLLEITLTETHKVDPERVAALKRRLGRALTLLPNQGVLRVRLAKGVSQDDILELLLSLVRILSGEEQEGNNRKKPWAGDGGVRK
ncbi:MAG: transcription-repair coupling factor [Schwartzia sp.]|nr:transcription-repair coupling factor [Schwartzia sp. (in: firmicutes)]